LNEKNVDNSIVTDRLTLKVLDENYANVVLSYFIRNKDYLKKWEASRDEEYFTLNYQKKELKNEKEKMKDGLMYKFWIFKKENDKLIGSIAFNNIVRGCFQSCHLGYRLDVDEINKGYMTEGLNAAINFAFEKLELHRIEANIMPRNKASLRSVEKFRFYNEGLARKYLKINNKWEDHIHMVLLNEKIE